MNRLFTSLIYQEGLRKSLLFYNHQSSSSFSNLRYMNLQMYLKTVKISSNRELCLVGKINYSRSLTINHTTLQHTIFIADLQNKTCILAAQYLSHISSENDQNVTYHRQVILGTVKILELLFFFIGDKVMLNGSAEGPRSAC